MEELAAHQRIRNIEGGVAFARKQNTPAKDAAREEILSIFSSLPGRAWFFTMPGLTWDFEKSLLSLREGENWLDHARGPVRTYFSAVENDRVVYHAAITQMPGMQCVRRSKVRVLGPRPWAERRVANDWVARYYFANVADVMRSRAGKAQYTAAWLDYTGPLNIERLLSIRDFFKQSVESVLVITALKARWSRETSDAIDRCGGHSKWVRRFFRGYRVLHDINYQDGASPMSQIAIAKRCAK